MHEDCKSYKKKMGQCRSYVCREFAMNYLARHLQNAHGVNTKAEAFVEASEYRQEVEEVTTEERQMYRDHTAEVAASRRERKAEKSGAGQQQQQQQQQKKPQEKPQERKRVKTEAGSTAESSTGGKRRRLEVAEPGPARNQLQDYLIKKTPQLRHFANMARRFAEGADEFAEVCETVIGMLEMPGAS